MNIILLGSNECKLYGHELPELISKLGKSLGGLRCTENIDTQLRGFYGADYPNCKEVRALHHSNEDVSKKESWKLLIAVSDRVELSMEDGRCGAVAWSTKECGGKSEDKNGEESKSHCRGVIALSGPTTAIRGQN